jgi:hypothetical protein
MRQKLDFIAHEFLIPEDRYGSTKIPKKLTILTITRLKNTHWRNSLPNGITIGIFIRQRGFWYLNVMCTRKKTAF